MPQFDFNLWKWRALYRRRLFFFCILQMVLIFQWFSIREIIHHSQAWIDNNDSHTGYRKFYEDIPILFNLSHCILLVTVLGTKVGRNLIHESQGKRLCDWSAFSLLLALAFLLVPLNDIKDQTTRDSRNVSFVTLGLFGIALYQHLGIAEPLLSLTLYAIFIAWIVYLSAVVSSLRLRFMQQLYLEIA